MNNILEMTVSHFFYEDPKTQTQMPLTMYLGGLSPLRAHFYQAAPPGPLTTVLRSTNLYPPGPLTNIAAFSYNLPASAAILHLLPSFGPQTSVILKPFNGLLPSPTTFLPLPPSYIPAQLRSTNLCNSALANPYSC
ncbi:hypothetical protein EV702DRAFT_1228886 [Suillus placidus]|uniref:Uncharacterized protein n=1 Tax=Suillus placidus TaxID=48579 RepID=A0A9P6ZU23_9AGAM|nr:hypothetical protein EV702DRAFT_1228886 [Suillus placidus]